MTRACALACRHCRAEAIAHRDPAELSTDEALRFVDDVAACGQPVFVLTGGDPLMRDDVYDIARYAASLGLPVAISPSATGRLTRGAIERLADAGVRTMSLSIDAPDAKAHDDFRGVRGSFERTLDAAAFARDCKLSLQVNTSVALHNHKRLAEFEPLLAPMGARMWSLFFVVPVGRAVDTMCLDAKQTEQAFATILDISTRAPFAVKTTEAPHYRRFVLQHGSDAATPRPAIERDGIGDGRGFVFVSHTGEIAPSGFLPLTLGNVRSSKLLDIYRNDDTMRRLRRPETFDGKCGFCEFQTLCGGSRARAFAVTGNPFASDPSCVYVPAFLT